MNYWMFAMISIGCIFIVFVGVSIYILWYIFTLILIFVTVISIITATFILQKAQDNFQL